MSKLKAGPVGEDGYHWQPGIVSNAGSWTLVNPDGAVLPCAEGRLATVQAEAEVYLLVNGAGTPQTDTDMDRATRVAEWS